MRRFLKKFALLSLLLLPMIVGSYNQSFAYSDHDEETYDEYTNEMKMKVQERLKEIRSLYPINLSRSKPLTIVLDPGHGGRDSGTSGNGLVEKKVNLDIAKAVKSKLESYGVNVVMTRDADLASNDKLELAERAAIANELGAALFVSLHNDSGGGDGAHVIHSIKGELSKTLATNIANSIRDNTVQNLKKYNPVWSRSYVNNKGETVDYYGVIRMTNMPAVIVEHAYLDNAKDVQAINTPEKIESMGNAVAEGIYITIQENFGRWEEKDGNKYYYDHNGVMQTGWLKYFDGSWYYFNEDGIMQTGWEKVDGKWYYLKSDGVMATGWLKLDGKWYHLKSNGEMSVGWIKVDGKWYYLKSNGEMATGWIKLNEKWYYLRSSGIMATGWEKVDGKWYYLKSDGEMATGWIKLNEKWYYLRSSGVMAVGWEKVDGKWYYLKSDGVMAKGWIKLNEKWYYLRSSGVMSVGWEKVDGKWYYLKSDGVMAKGWLDLNGKRYYLKDNGEMVTGKVKIGNKTYNFDSSGALIK